MPKIAQEIQNIIDAHSNIPVHLQDELSYRHMVMLANLFEHLALCSKDVDEERAAQFLGAEKGMRDMAWLVGEDWAPPEPERPTNNKSLREILDESSEPLCFYTKVRLKQGLAYRHMVALSEAYVDWIYDKRVTIEQSVRLLAMANNMQKLAEEVGSEWNPPEPKRLNLTQFIARELLDEK